MIINRSHNIKYFSKSFDLYWLIEVNIMNGIKRVIRYYECVENDGTYISLVRTCKN